MGPADLRVAGSRGDEIREAHRAWAGFGCEGRAPTSGVEGRAPASGAPGECETGGDGCGCRTAGCAVRARAGDPNNVKYWAGGN